MQALEMRHQHEDAGQPGFADEVRAFVDERFRYRGEHEQGPANDTGSPRERAAWAVEVRAGRWLAWLADARLDRPDQQPARAGHAPGDRAAARRRARCARHRPRLRADARAVRAPRASSTPPSATIAASACWPRPAGLSRSAALLRWARAARAPAGALRHRARSRLQRRLGGGRAAADTQLDDVRLRVGHRPAQRQLPSGARRGGARGDPARAPGRYGARGKISALRGPEGGVLPGRLRARRRRPGRARRWTRARPIVRRAHAAGGVALPPLPQRPVRGRAASGCASAAADGTVRRRWCCPASTPSARSCAAFPASSCPSTRSTPSR